MNRDQAVELLQALGSDDHGDRRDAIVIVLDLLQQKAATQLDITVDGATDARLVDREGALFPGSLRSMNAEIERLRKVTEADRLNLAGWAKLWRRVMKLVGRESTSPESVIDRIAFLAEVEKSRPTQHRVDELQMELHRVEVQRNDLLTAARAVLAEPFGPTLATKALAELVERIDRQNETPAEGAARLRVE